MQNTLSVSHSFLTWPCSPHLKHIGAFLLLDEFGELLKKPLQPVGLVVCGGKVVCVDALALLLSLHALLQPVVLVMNCPPEVTPAPWIIESFAGGSYQLL